MPTNMPKSSPFGNELYFNAIKRDEGPTKKNVIPKKALLIFSGRSLALQCSHIIIELLDSSRHFFIGILCLQRGHSI